MARLRPVIRSAAVAGAVVLLGSCMTGPRPSFSEDLAAPGTLTGDAAVDSVLERLDRAAAATFTGGYEILTKYGTVTSQAEVVQSAPDHRTIAIGDARFVIDGSSTTTCRHGDEGCVGRIDDSVVSDLQVTHRFYAEAAAASLRRAAANRLGAGVSSTETIAGRRARCVSVDVSGGSARYCALRTGTLALLDDAAVRVTLTAYCAGTRSPDPSAGRSTPCRS